MILWFGWVLWYGVLLTLVWCCGLLLLWLFGAWFCGCFSCAIAFGFSGCLLLISRLLRCCLLLWFIVSSGWFILIMLIWVVCYAGLVCLV